MRLHHVCLPVAFSILVGCTGLLGGFEVQPGQADAGSTSGGPSPEAGGAPDDAGGDGASLDGPVPPTCSSPKAACGPACVDLASDDKNCGACGRGCLGGTCTNRVCQPFLLDPRTDVDARTLTSTDGDLFYATTANEVWQKPVGSAPHIRLATAGGMIYGIATAPPSRVFFTAANAGSSWTVWSATVGGGASGDLGLSVGGTPVGLVVAGGNLWTQQVTTATTFSIIYMPLVGPPGFNGSGASGHTPGSRIVAGGGYVYYTDTFGLGVYAMPESVGLAKTIAPTEGTATDAVWDGAGTLYWAACNIAPCPLRASPFPNPAPVTVRSFPGGPPNDLRADANQIYWSSFTGTGDDLWAVPKANPTGMPLRVAHGAISRFVTTLVGLYWAEPDGIHGVRKP